jgi:PucR C-terminal helix-turn-helix domain
VDQVIKTDANRDSRLVAEPWRRLPAEVADLIEPELERATEEILAAIGREVPQYARPLEGAFGRDVRRGVSEALWQFVALVRDPDAGREHGRDVYRALGRGELRAGRTLDALQSAYRVGARVAWHRLAAAARRARLDADDLSVLAESVFAYIDEISADSVEGYAHAQSEREGELQRRRRELLTALLRQPPASEAQVAAAAAPIGWRSAPTMAALACREADLARIGGRLSTDALAAPIEGAGCAIVADPTGPGRRGELARAARGAPAALGPPGERRSLAASWRLARLGLAALEAGTIAGPSPLFADERLLELLPLEAPAVLARLAARRIAPLAGLTPKSRARMTATALAFIRHRGNAPAMAAAMGVHPQTARYRLARLRELYGADLEDPDARLELELALRAGNGDEWHARQDSGAGGASRARGA